MRTLPNVPRVKAPVGFNGYRRPKGALPNAAFLHQPFEFSQFFCRGIALERYFANDTLKSRRFFGNSVKAGEIGVSLEGDLVPLYREFEKRRVKSRRNCLTRAHGRTQRFLRIRPLVRA